MPTPEFEELYRFSQVAYDVALNFGNTSEQSITRMKRLLNRAAVRISTEKNRNWSWLKKIGYFDTASSTTRYTLAQDLRSPPRALWIEGSNERRLRRIPERTFRDVVPDRTEDSGTPSHYDFEGVNSQGSRVISVWPVPTAVERIYYSYKRIIMPLTNDEADIRGSWGMPPDVIEALIEYATALAFKPSNDARYQEQMGEAQALLDMAYKADQDNIDTMLRAPFTDDDDAYDGDPKLEARYGV